MLAPVLGEIIPGYCPHCGWCNWAGWHEDGVDCVFCGCILYKDDPIDDLRDHGGQLTSQSDKRLKKNRRC